MEIETSFPSDRSQFNSIDLRGTLGVGTDILINKLTLAITKQEDPRQVGAEAGFWRGRARGLL